MLKIAIAAIAAVGFGFFALHGRGGDGSAKARSCLETAGATVQHSTFFEDVFTAAAADQEETMPEPFLDLVGSVTKSLYEVRFADTTATLLFAANEHHAENVYADAVDLGVPLTTVPPQRFGTVLVFWPQEPTPAASASVSSCLT